jgi:hypothetical protein
MMSIKRQAHDLSIVAKDSGNAPEEVHEALKDMFAPKKMIKLGRTEQVISGCTHDLFKDNFFEDYIWKIQAWYAQEFNGVIPDPKEVEL